MNDWMTRALEELFGTGTYSMSKEGPTSFTQQKPGIIGSIRNFFEDYQNEPERVPEPTPSPSPTLTPTPTPYLRDQEQLQNQITQGLEKSGFGNAPVNELITQLAQVGSQLPEPVDPYLPVIVALMESGGGQNLSSPNNLYNIGPGISYPSLEVALMGGGPEEQLGFQGLLRPEGLYQDYLESGDLNDFFSRFTPASDPLNPSQEELLQRYNTLRAYFE